MACYNAITAIVSCKCLYQVGRCVINIVVPRVAATSHNSISIVNDIVWLTFEHGNVIFVLGGYHCARVILVTVVPLGKSVTFVWYCCKCYGVKVWYGIAANDIAAIAHFRRNGTEEFDVINGN